MDDRTAASGGLLLAAVALLSALVGIPGRWSTPAVTVALLAALSVAGFALRRADRLGRRQAAPVAGLAAVGAILAWVPLAVGSSLSAAMVLGMQAAGGAAIAAYADWRALDAEALSTRAGGVAVAVALGAAGILAIYAWLLPIGIVVGAIAPGGVGRPGEILLSTLASGAGTVTVVALYLRWSDHGLAFLDVRMPNGREVGYAIGGTFLILAGNVGIGLAFQRAGVEVTTHTIVRAAAADPWVLLALMPLSYLVIAPGEELLYRNVVQKTLRESFSPAAGVALASAVFAIVHLPSYVDPDGGMLATLSTIVVVFVLALVLGALYERTDNVVVSILAHGTFNAVAFAATYAQLTGLLGG